jgi:hypothetical protein
VASAMPEVAPRTRILRGVVVVCGVGLICLVCPVYE